MSMILVADREVVAELKREEEAEAPEIEVSDVPTGPTKAERRAAKQKKADEAIQAEEQGAHADSPSVEAEDGEPGTADQS